MTARLRVVPARTRADFEAGAAVVSRVSPDSPVTAAEIEHSLTTGPDAAFLLAWVGETAVGTAFTTRSSIPDCPFAMVRVLPEYRRGGVGAALYAAVSERARAAGYDSAWGRVREDDRDSVAAVRGRGFEAIGRECAVVLDLARAGELEPEPLPGIQIVSLAQRLEVARAAYDVERETIADIPGPERTTWSFERWQAETLKGPGALPEALFVALADGEAVGYAALAALPASPGTAEHLLTAVRRAWRHRGIATTLKLAQIAWARGAGLERLITWNDETNVAMRGINARLGYEPTVGSVMVRGPLAPG